MSFNCSICGVALDLIPGEVPLLGEDENQKRIRWLQQAGQHFSVVHPEVMGQALMLQGAVGLVHLLSNVRTDDTPMLQKFTNEQNALVQHLRGLSVPFPAQEATVQ